MKNSIMKLTKNEVDDVCGGGSVGDWIKDGVVFAACVLAPVVGCVVGLGIFLCLTTGKKTVKTQHEV